MNAAFAGCSNLTYIGEDTPDLSQVTDMYLMFYKTPNFNGSIGDWDVSNVENMSGMFYCSSFNQDIGDWDVSGVTNMSSMFSEASSFN